MPKLKITIEYGLYLLAFLLPLQTRWIIRAGETEYLTYSLYGTDILLIGLLLLFIFYKFSIFNFQFSKNFQFFNFQTNLIIGLLVIFGVSMFFAVDKSLALYKLGWLVLGAGLFWLMAKADYGRLKLVGSLLFGLTLQALLAVWQFLAQAAFANKWLGLAAHRAADLGTSVVETVGADGVGERWLRAYGGLDHPNMLGGMLAIGIIFLIGEIIAGEKFNNFQFSIFNFQTIFNTKIFKMIAWTFLTLFSAALFFSFSRAAWLALAVGLGVGLMAAAAKKDLAAQKYLLQSILVSGIIFFIMFWQLPNLAITRLYSSERLEIKSASERIESVKNAWPIIKKSWPGGTGMGNYVLALKRQLPGRESYFYQPAHNAFLLIWSEIGMIGLLLFIFVILNLVIRNYLEIKNWKLEIGKIENGENVIIKIPVVVAIIVLFCFDHWLWSLHFGVLFFWLTAGLAARSENKAGCG